MSEASGATAVLFDLDGTLIDLPVDVERVRTELALRFATPGGAEAFRPILAAIDTAAAGVSMEARGRAALRGEARARLDAAELEAVAAVRPRPGAAEVLAALGARGVPFGVLTDNGRACVAPALAAAGLSAWPPAAISTRDDAPTKPDPTGLLAVAATLLPAGGTLWYVGDLPRDLATAHAAATAHRELRVLAAAVLGGRGTREALVDAAPDVLLGALPELLPLLQGGY